MTVKIKEVSMPAERTGSLLKRQEKAIQLKRPSETDKHSECFLDELLRVAAERKKDV